MPTFEFVSDFLYSNLLLTTVRNNEFVARCPFCGDSKKNPKKKRFHVKFVDDQTIFFNCFNCGHSGSFIDLYSFIKGIDHKQAWKELRTDVLDILKNRKEKC